MLVEQGEIRGAVTGSESHESDRTHPIAFRVGRYSSTDGDRTAWVEPVNSTTGVPLSSTASVDRRSHTGRRRRRRPSSSQPRPIAAAAAVSVTVICAPVTGKPPPPGGTRVWGRTACATRSSPTTAYRSSPPSSTPGRAESDGADRSCRQLGTADEDHREHHDAPCPSTPGSDRACQTRSRLTSMGSSPKGEACRTPVLGAGHRRSDSAGAACVRRRGHRCRRRSAGRRPGPPVPGRSVGDRPSRPMRIGRSAASPRRRCHPTSDAPRRPGSNRGCRQPSAGESTERRTRTTARGGRERAPHGISGSRRFRAEP